MKLHALLVAAVALAVGAAGCLSPGASVDPAAAPLATGALMADAQALAHLAGDNATGRIASEIEARLLSIGRNAAEPTIGVTKEGVLFYAAITFDNQLQGQQLPVPTTDIVRSQDGGKTWEDVTPRLPGGIRQHLMTGDPMVHVDVDTGRVFDIDQQHIACYLLSTSDDLGASWSPPSDACITPPADHQTITTFKTRVLPTVGYANGVLVCYNQIATTSCARSLDGGRTFQPAGVVGSQGVRSSLDPETGDGLCSALVGHLAAAPDGTLYLPRAECGDAMVYVSRDDAITWEAVKVSERPALGGKSVSPQDPAVAVDAEGNVHYVWQADDGHLYLASSTDGGATWSPERDILAPGLTAALVPTIAAGDAGRVAIGYYASNVTGGYEAEDEVMATATWDGYLAVITDALAPQPTILTTRVNPADDPLVKGPCGPGRCPGVYDFMDVVIDSQGRPWAAFVDACIDECAAAAGTADDNTGGGGLGLVATLARGPALRGEAELAALA